MKLFRQIIFWAHLVTGLAAGLVIAILCFTGAALAFEQELVAWTERDVRRVVPPAPDASRLSLEEMLQRVRALNPEARPSSISLANDPKAAMAFSVGREAGFYVNPYTGEVRRPPSPNKVHEFLDVLESWHRTLARSGDQRAAGKLATGISNLAFFGLAVSGLYLWWPRKWGWRSLRPSVWFMQNYKGKARDLNWHNTLGFWSAPVLIVLTLTAVPMSFRWGGNLIYQIAGETPPEPGAGGQGPGGGGMLSPQIELSQPPPGTRSLSPDAFLAIAQKEFPQWDQITVRLTAVGPRGDGQRGGSAAGARGPGTASTAPDAAAAGRPAASSTEPDAGGQRPRGTGEGRPAASPVTVTIKESSQWPRTANTSLTLNPFTGDILKREGYGDLPTSRKIRSWTRFLHTGQALGWVGQLVAGLACLAACVLVYTGFALAWRRFLFKRRTSKPAAAQPAA